MSQEEQYNHKSVKDFTEPWLIN